MAIQHVIYAIAVNILFDFYYHLTFSQNWILSTLQIYFQNKLNKTGTWRMKGHRTLPPQYTPSPQVSKRKSMKIELKAFFPFLLFLLSFSFSMFSLSLFFFIVVVVCGCRLPPCPYHCFIHFVWRNHNTAVTASNSLSAKWISYEVYSNFFFHFILCFSERHRMTSRSTTDEINCQSIEKWAGMPIDIFHSE